MSLLPPKTVGEKPAITRSPSGELARAVDHVSQLTLAGFPAKCNCIMLAHPAKGSAPYL